MAIVQGNVPRDFEGTLYDKEITIIESHADLTSTIPPGSVDLVVWPESSVGIDPTTDERAGALMSTAAREVGVPMIVGANLDVDNDHYKVMALLVSPAGEIVDRYQKTHLVPFGEYIPARSLIDWVPMLDQVPRDAIPASETVLFNVAGGIVAPVISFEGDFGSLVRGRIEAGGRLLVVATNTSTWGDTGASPQHVAFSQVRAVENGVWVAHGAISGLSAFIRPNGDIVEQTELRTAAVIVATLRFSDSTTFYARVGDWLPIACLLFSVLLVVSSRRRLVSVPG